MKKNVYIKNIVYLTDGFDNIKTDGNTDKIGRMCVYAIEKLFEGISGTKDMPVFFGSAYSSLKSLHEFNGVCEEKGALYVNPSMFPNAVLNSPSCRAGIYHKITSPIYNISNGLYSGLNALELAFLYLFNGSFDNAVVCVAEESSEFAEKSESRKIADACGAIFLTTRKEYIELWGICKNLKTKNIIESHQINQSTDVIRAIENSIYSGFINYADEEIIIKINDDFIIMNTIKTPDNKL